MVSKACPKGPCAQIAYTLAPKYLYRDYFKAKVYTIWVHGGLELKRLGCSELAEDCDSVFSIAQTNREEPNTEFVGTLQKVGFGSLR